MRKKKKKNDINIKQNTERYLITYADLLTLLFALFIILYSISKPDSEKMEAVLKAMNNVFNPAQIIDGNNISPNASSNNKPEVVIFTERKISIPELQEEVEFHLDNLIKNNTIGFEKTSEGVKLTIDNKFLFPSAKANLVDASRPVLDEIAASLRGVDMQIFVDGHTDNVPIKSITYPSNWELSAARAVSVVQALIQRGVAEQDLVARGFSSQRPKYDNSTEEGRKQNRRVEIVVAQKDPTMVTSTAETLSKNRNSDSISRHKHQLRTRTTETPP